MAQGVTLLLQNSNNTPALLQPLIFWRRNYFFLILAHPVYKMWIIQEPNTLELWNKLHFEEEKTDSTYGEAGTIMTKQNSSFTETKHIFRQYHVMWLHFGSSRG